MNPQLMFIPVLVGLSVMALGGALLLPRWMARNAMRARLRGSEGGVMPLRESSGGRYLGTIRSIGKAVSSKKVSVGLREKLMQAGYHESGASAIYMGAKTLLFAFGFIGAMVLVLPTGLIVNLKIFWIMLTSVGLYMLPNLVVGLRRGKRRGDMRRHLPDAIDLLEICGSAGMGLDMAWNAVTDEIRTVSPILADEMTLCNLEIHLGAARLEAMRHMALRTGVDELSGLVAMLVQAERFGTSINDSMRVFATSMRENRSQLAQEAAEKMAVKLLVPMIIFIFPAAIMIMVGPAFMTLYKVLGS